MTRDAKSIRAAKLRAKNERRARFFEQGCTDDGRPIDDPAYAAWLAGNGQVAE